MNPLPFIDNVCGLDPAVSELGDKLEIVGTGFCGGGGGEPPLCPPLHPAKEASPSKQMIEPMDADARELCMTPSI